MYLCDFPVFCGDASTSKKKFQWFLKEAIKKVGIDCDLKMEMALYGNERKTNQCGIKSGEKGKKEESLSIYEIGA